MLLVANGAGKRRVRKMNTKREDRKRAAIEQQIDENLRKVYEQDVMQALPDRFAMLLAQLREKEAHQ